MERASTPDATTPTAPQVEVETFNLSDKSVYFSGPPLDQGPLPALLYFSLSGQESLSLAPYNSPVAYLSDQPMRCFSIDLPGHGVGLDPNRAMESWVEDPDSLIAFVDKLCHLVDALFEQGLVTKLAAAGLSRGAFVATHLAARHKKVEAVLGYAPLTDLAFYRETGGHLALHLLADKLITKRLRYYMGNRDILTGTRTCFEFIEAVVEAAYAERIRSPQVDMIITPSTGHKGHGTPQHIFYDGAMWLKGVLK